MNTLLTLTNTKENIFEFDVDVKGIKEADMSVKFIIETEITNLEFVANPEKDLKWSVKIPPLPFLEKTTYPFCINVIVDGYFFEAMRGSLSVIDEYKVSVSEPTNKTLEPAKSSKKITKKINVVDDNKEQKEKSSVKKSTNKPKPIKIEDNKKVLDNIKAKKAKKQTSSNKDVIDPTIQKIIDDVKKETLLKKENNKKEEQAKKEEKAQQKEKQPNKKETEKKNDEKQKSKDQKVENKEKENTSNKKEKEKAIKEDKSYAKVMAKNIIETVTGRNKKPTISEKDLKVKKILKEELKEKSKQKVENLNIDPNTIKKITTEGKIVEIDKEKEESIKNVLKNIN